MLQWLNNRADGLRVKYEELGSGLARLGQYHPAFHIAQMNVTFKKKWKTANLSILPNKDI